MASVILAVWNNSLQHNYLGYNHISGLTEKVHFSRCARQQ